MPLAGRLTQGHVRVLAAPAASFRRELRTAGKAERTIILYRHSIRFLSDWLTDQGRRPDTDALTKHAVVGWLESLRDK